MRKYGNRYLFNDFYNQYFYENLFDQRQLGLSFKSKYRRNLSIKFNTLIYFK